MTNIFTHTFLKNLKQSLLIVLLWLCWLSYLPAATDCNLVTEIPQTDCEALLDFFNSTNGTEWKNNTGWNVNNAPCTTPWHGITCNEGRVTRLNLANNNLTGNLPSNLSALTGLWFLYLNKNQLTGSIPNLDTLENLRVLHLGENQLSEPIPDLRKLIHLRDLLLHTNQLSGSIPNFSGLAQLRELRLENNQLEGPLQSKFNDLPNLERLDLYRNPLKSELPDLSSLIKLRILLLHHNELIGTIPELNTLINLENLHLYENQLEGSIPNLSNLTKLKVLRLSGNNLSGAIPALKGLDFKQGELWLDNHGKLCKVDDFDYGKASEIINKFPSCPPTTTTPPTANFTADPTEGCSPLKITLDGSQSFDSDGEIVAYDWLVNGENLSLSTTDTANFQITSSEEPHTRGVVFEVGTYVVELKVTDNDGLTDTAQKTITVTACEPRTLTLILTNYEKLAQFYGPTEASQVLSKLEELANDADVAGLVIQVEKDASVAAAYADRGHHYEDKNKTNAVADAIKQVIVNNWSEHLENIVIVGDDRIMPFYRIEDGTHQRDLFTLTDDFYTDRNPTNCTTGCANPKIYIPDIASGRLVETPSQIIAVIETFLSKKLLRIESAAVTGYDFVKDGAQEHCDHLRFENPNHKDCSLIGEEWTKQDFMSLILDTHHDMTSINGHATYDSFGSPNDSVYVSDFSETLTDFAGTLFYTVGCHSGLNKPNNIDDLPESMAILKANYIANTGFGWGGGGVILSEELMLNLTKELQKPGMTLGKALRNAKQQYFADNPNFSSYDEKIVAESTLYGLPMYQIRSETIAPLSSAIEVEKTETTQENGLQKDAYTYKWDQPTALSENSFSLDGKVAGHEGEPILPKLSSEVTHTEKALRGVVFRGGNYITVDKVPPLQRFKTTTGYLSPERTFSAPGWYPSIFFQPHTVQLNGQKKETVVATTGQYNPNLGQQRIFNNIKFDLYYHTDPSDLVLPEVYLTSSRLEGHTATVTVTTSDTSGIEGVVITYTNGKGTWNATENMTKGSGEQWSGTFAAESNTQFLIHSIDKAGNVAINDNEGRYFNFFPIQFQGLKTFYNVGETATIELIENQAVSLRTESVDLWVAIQLPSGEFLFRTASPKFPFSLEPQVFKRFVPIQNTQDTRHTILEIEIPPGIGGKYTFYALYVAEGKNPLIDGLEAVARSNLAVQVTELASE